MRKLSVAACVLALVAPLAALAQNVAVVNGKAVPKARVDALVAQATKGGQPKTPELEKQARDEVVMREMFMQEAEKRGVARSPEVAQQLEFARQQIVIRELFEDFKKKNPVSDADIDAEYNKVKGQSTGNEYRARHILVDKEEDAKALIAQIKAGSKFEDVAKKNSKDPGSAENGGDLDYAKPENFVKEFSDAMTKLKKGEMTDTPVKSEHGWHIIKLEDVRPVQFPPLADIKPQIKQHLEQQKLLAYRDEIRKKAKTDYTFSSN
jgi:peptidyl-prolyl cis-trans isomerase C